MIVPAIFLCSVLFRLYEIFQTFFIFMENFIINSSINGLLNLSKETYYW